MRNLSTIRPFITGRGGRKIAALSEAGRNVWAPKLGHVRSATVTAMLRRTRDQETEAYRTGIRVDAWEIPVVEICWDSSPDRRAGLRS